jgi:hypothetical protein
MGNKTSAVRTQPPAAPQNADPSTPAREARSAPGPSGGGERPASPASEDLSRSSASPIPLGVSSDPASPVAARDAPSPAAGAGDVRPTEHPRKLSAIVAQTSEAAHEAAAAVEGEGQRHSARVETLAGEDGWRTARSKQRMADRARACALFACSKLRCAPSAGQSQSSAVRPWRLAGAGRSRAAQWSGDCDLLHSGTLFVG